MVNDMFPHLIKSLRFNLIWSFVIQRFTHSADTLAKFRFRFTELRFDFNVHFVVVKRSVRSDNISNRVMSQAMWGVRLRLNSAIDYLRTLPAQRLKVGLFLTPDFVSTPFESLNLLFIGTEVSGFGHSVPHRSSCTNDVQSVADHSVDPSILVSRPDRLLFLSTLVNVIKSLLHFI